MIDFSQCEQTNIVYSGSEKKLGIYWQGDKYMLKFRKEVQGELSYNHVSEFLSSHIMSLMGLPVHETVLGLYQGQEVVAVKDFVSGTGSLLIEFSASGDSSFDTERQDHLSYEYEEILYLLKSHSRFIDTSILRQRFWDMFIADALVANFDRHGYNWGFLKNGNQYQLAPIYDNGSSLFPRLQDKDLARIMGDEKELEKRTYEFPTSQIKLDGKKSSYYEIIHSGRFAECKEAKERVLAALNMERVCRFIEQAPFISSERATFYKCVLDYRFMHIFTL